MTKYIELFQINNDIEVYRILKNGKIVVTKRCKIGINGYVNPIFLREINILKCLSNPPEHLANHEGRHNIIKLLDVYEKDDYLHFDMENAIGNLMDLGKLIDLSLVKDKILMDISDGLQYVHEFGLNHLDLGFKNIVFIGDVKTLNLKFLLIDFGNAVHINRMHTYHTSTYYTMAYELVLMSKFKNFEMFHHRKPDIWSLGLLAYILYTDNTLTDGESLDSQYERLNNILTNPHNPQNTEIHTSLTACISGKTINIIDKEIINKTNLMLIIDPNYRPVVYFSKIRRTKSQSQLQCKYDMKTINEHLNKLTSTIESSNFNMVDFQFKTIISWLMDHIYSNHVETLPNIIQYITTSINNNNFNFGNTYENKYQNLKTMCQSILNCIDYNFEIS